jgi:hypothetical protein
MVLFMTVPLPFRLFLLATEPLAIRYDGVRKAETLLGQMILERNVADQTLHVVNRIMHLVLVHTHEIVRHEVLQRLQRRSNVRMA